MQWIYPVSSGVWESETEPDGYYCLYTLGVWIEILVHDGRFPAKKIGARWTIDGWKTHCDTLAFFARPAKQEELWRVEINNLVTTGWRDGSIGGPNGEQPSGKVWTLWGADKKHVRCLPLGSAPPCFEYALFMNIGESLYWENNLQRNFRIDLSRFSKKPEII